MGGIPQYRELGLISFKAAGTNVVNDFQNRYYKYDTSLAPWLNPPGNTDTKQVRTVVVERRMVADVIIDWLDDGVSIY